jgi:uncharacterized membrane protein
MRRVQVFIIVFTVSLSVIFALLAVGVYLATVQPAQYSSSWVGQMWSGMGNSGMGGMMGGGNGASTASYFWIIPAALIGIAIVGGVGLAFYVAFPEIRTAKETGFVSNSEPSSISPKPVMANAAGISSEGVDPYELISRTMTPDEKKVLDVLTSHDGKYLQKYIKSETGLSRLQTHRIVARLADRGVVSVKQVGNTNEVLVSDWLKSCKVQKAA